MIEEQTDNQVTKEESEIAFECNAILNSMAKSIENLIRQKEILKWIG